MFMTTIPLRLSQKKSGNQQNKKFFFNENKCQWKADKKSQFMKQRRIGVELKIKCILSLEAKNEIKVNFIPNAKRNNTANKFNSLFYSQKITLQLLCRKFNQLMLVLVFVLA